MDQGKNSLNGAIFLPFATYAHGKFSNAEFSAMPEAFFGDGKLADLLPVYERMGSLLVSKYTGANYRES